jgi:hypothetical protein
MLTHDPATQWSYEGACIPPSGAAQPSRAGHELSKLAIAELNPRSCQPTRDPACHAVTSTLPELQSVTLFFSVSTDEEYVRLRAVSDCLEIDLGSRCHNFLLLTLARRRLSDALAGGAETACGWIYMDDLAHDPSMAPARLNIDVCRIRQQFAACGIVRAATIIERRRSTQQIRLGTDRIRIARL